MVPCKKKREWLVANKGLRLDGSPTYIAATGWRYRPRTRDRLEPNHLSGGMAVFGQLGFCLHYRMCAIYHTRHTLILACGIKSIRSKLLFVTCIPNESIRWINSSARHMFEHHTQRRAYNTANWKQNPMVGLLRVEASLLGLHG